MRAPDSKTKSVYKAPYKQGTFSLRPNSPLDRARDTVVHFFKPSPSNSRIIGNAANAVGHATSGAAGLLSGGPHFLGPKTTPRVAPTKPVNPDPTGSIARQDAVANLLSKTGVPGLDAMNSIINQRGVQHPLSSMLPKNTTVAKPAAPKTAPKPVSAPSVLPSHTTPATHLSAANVPARGGSSSSTVAVGGSRSGGGGSVGSSSGVAAKPGVDPLTGKATAAVDAELNPQLAALTEQLRQLTEHHTSDVTDANQHSVRQQTDLQALYDRLTNFTGGVKSTQDANYGNERTSDASNFAALQNQLAQTFGAGQQATNTELDRLGLGAASPDATAALSRDSQYLKGLTGVDAANANANIGARQGGFDSLMAMMQGNAQTEGTVQRGQASRDSAKILADLNSKFNDASGTLNSQSGAIKATRGTKIQEMLSALQHQQAADQQAAETAAFNRQLALSNLGIKQSTLSLNQQKALSQAGYTDAQIAHLANSDKVAQQNANTNASRAAASGKKATTTAKPPTGIDGANAILNGYTSSPHQRDVANEFNTLLNGTYNNTGTFDTAGHPIKPGKPSISDPVTMAHAADWFKRNQAKGITQADYNTLIRALAALGGKVGHA